MFGGDNAGTVAVQKESFGTRKPKRAYEHDSGMFGKTRPAKRKPRVFGDAEPSDGLDFAAIMGRRK